MNYREYANQRANDIELLTNTFAPEKKVITEVIVKFLRENTKLDRTNEMLKAQTEKILGREMHWAEMDLVGNIMVSMIDTSNIDLEDGEDIMNSIMSKGLRLMGVPEYEIESISSDLNGLVFDIKNEIEE